MKVKKRLKDAGQAILMVAGLFLVGVPPIITVGVAMILLSIILFSLDCIKLYEESLREEDTP